MALYFYTDAATTNQALPNEVFEDASEINGTNKNFVLTLITGIQVGSVFLETRTSYASITFSAGVSSALSGATYTVDELVGKRVIHNGEFRGTITSNTSNTITLDSSYTQATASNCIISTYTAQTLTTQYSILGNTITMVTAPPTGSRLHVVPTDDLNIAFGGDPGTAVTVTGSVWLKREPGYQYRSIRAYSQDNSIDDVVFTQTGVTSSGTTVSGFTGLSTNAFAGYAFWHNGAYRGLVVSNTDTTLTIDTSYTEATAYDAQLFNIGPMLLCLTEGGTYLPVISIPDITTDTAVRVYYKDTVTIPNNPMNYPNIIIKAAGIEYLE